MTRVFVDTAYYIALVSPRDALHVKAVELARATLQEDMWTSEPVLTEVLNHFGGTEPYLRTAALEFVDRVRRDARTNVIRQTPDLWAAGLDLYRRRPDKGYGHTDCMSMAICLEHGISHVLTHDHHFAQEGFDILL